MQREDAALAGSHQPRLEGTAQPWPSGVLSAPELFPLAASVSTETRLRGPGAAPPLHRPPCVAPPPWKPLLSQTCRLSKPLGPVARAAACPGDHPKPVPVRDTPGKHLAHGSSLTYGPRGKAGQLEAGSQHSQAVAPRCLFAQESSPRATGSSKKMTFKKVVFCRVVFGLKKRESAIQVLGKPLHRWIWLFRPKRRRCGSLLLTER